MSSIRDLILAANDIEKESITIPEWGGVTLEMRSPTARERMDMFRENTDGDGKVNTDTLFPLLIVTSAHDPETGDAVFTLSDIDALTEKSAAVIERVAGVVMRIAGMLPEAVDLGKGVS